MFLTSLARYPSLLQTFPIQLSPLLIRRVSTSTGFRKPLFNLVEYGLRYFVLANINELVIKLYFLDEQFEETEHELNRRQPYFYEGKFFQKDVGTGV